MTGSEERGAQAWRRRLEADWRAVGGDFVEAARTGRQPEQVQAERHAREHAAIAGPMVRWWRRIARKARRDA